MDRFTCVPKFCDNPTLDPNKEKNFNLTWDNNLIPLKKILKYECQTGMVFEANTTWKNLSTNSIDVLCGDDGEFLYPDKWPQCSADISCGTPPQVPSNGSITWLQGENGADNYSTVIQYKCVKGSQFDTDNDTVGDSVSIITQCLWSKDWSPWAKLPACIFTHCPDPFPIPTDSNLFALTTNWTEIKKNKWYKCGDGRYFETDRSLTQFSMTCLEDGTFNFTNKRENWPTCLTDFEVHCGPPPSAPANGSRVWLTGDEPADYYNRTLIYNCIKGSQFDTNNDQIGDSPSVQITCLWNKTWSPWRVLPPCIITHCVDPFEIPGNTSLEETSSLWTKINTYKEYRCTGRINNVHTKYLQYDRTRSTFKMKCLPNGKFDFVNETQHWPICLEGNFFTF